MSIQLRLTLLYSTIVAVTIITFGSILYITQSREAFDSILGQESCLDVPKMLGYTGLEADSVPSLRMHRFGHTLTLLARSEGSSARLRIELAPSTARQK